MYRCKGICTNGLRCKKKTINHYCNVHDESIICQICNKHVNMNDRFTISECGHKFHKKCLTDSFMNNQWYDGFSTNDKIYCPECKIEFSDDSWTKISCLLVDCKILERKIIYKTYLCYKQYLDLKQVLQLDQEYDYNQFDTIRRHYDRLTGTWHNDHYFLNKDYVEQVILKKYVPREIYYYQTTDTNYYIFSLGDPDIKNLFQPLQKELIEYVFHPDRVKLEELD